MTNEFAARVRQLLRPSKSGGHSSRAWILPACVVAAAFFVRYAFLGSESLWNDELASVVFTRNGPLEAIKAAIGDTGPPLYYILQSIVNSVLGVNEVGMRLLSATAGGLSVWGVHALGRRLYGPTTAVIAAAMMAFAQSMIFFSQEARAYSLAVLLCVCTALAVVRALESGKTLDYVLYALSATAAAYTHLFAFIAVAGISAGVLVRPRLVKRLGARWLYALLAFALAYVPWLFVLARQAKLVALRESEGQWVLSPPADLFAAFYDALVRYIPWAGGNPVLWAAFAGLLLFGAFAAADYDRPAAVPEPGESFDILHLDRTAILVGWIGAVYIGGLLVSKLIVPIFDYRMASVAAPALYLLASHGLRKLWRPAAALLVAALVVYAVHGMYSYYTTSQKQQWREATQYLQSVGAERDGIVAYTTFMLTNVSEYARILGDPDGVVGERVVRGLGDSEYDQIVQKHGADRSSLWLVEGHVAVDQAGLTDLDRAMLRNGWALESERDFNRIWVKHFVRSK